MGTTCSPAATTTPGACAGRCEPVWAAPRLRAAPPPPPLNPLRRCRPPACSKLWGGPKFRLLRTLAGHEGKVMGGDICPDGSFTVATSGYDRTLKLYGPDPLAAIEAEAAAAVAAAAPA